MRPQGAEGEVADRRWTRANPGIWLEIGLILCLAVLPARAEEKETPWVAILAVPEANPPVDQVISVLYNAFAELEIDVKVHRLDAPALPVDNGEWVASAHKAHEADPGMLALFGYSCGKAECRLFIVEAEHGALTSLPVPLAGEQGSNESNVALAGTIREALLGPILPELDRLVRHGASPAESAPTPASFWLNRGAPEQVESPAPEKRPWLWVEGGYQGDLGFPGGRPIHGPWAGAAWIFHRVFSAALGFGWMGIQTGEVNTGQTQIHRLSTTLSLRLTLDVGPARLGLAPVGRLDVVFPQADPLGPRGAAAQDNAIEFQAGGVTTFQFPMPFAVDFLLGAGILGTFVGESYKVDQVTAIPASKVRIVWQAGVAWGAL